jgi:hypothetical protein
MPRLLADLRAGTPVLDNSGAQIGEVRSVYGSGDAQSVEYILVFWNARGEEALIPADEAMRIDDDGVTLRQSGEAYNDRPAFDPAANPLLHRL